jgi:mannosyltransferase OCH1-like enzyme
MIPKLIHQTAKTTDISPKWREYQSKLRAFHPDWTYRLWTDDDNIAFVRSEFPEFVQTFTSLPRNIMRADVIRYLLMYRLGGLYMDLDYEMLKPFDLLEQDIVLPLESDGQFGPGNDKVCNSIFAAAPGHPLFKMAIEDLKNNPPTPQADVEASTGPIFLSRIFRAALAAGIEVYTPARPLFSPPTPENPRQYRAIIDQGVSYGIHHCDGTWRQYSWPQRFRNKLAKAVKQFL